MQRQLIWNKVSVLVLDLPNQRTRPQMESRLNCWTACWTWPNYATLKVSLVGFCADETLGWNCLNQMRPSFSQRPSRLTGFLYRFLLSGTSVTETRWCRLSSRCMFERDWFRHRDKVGGLIFEWTLHVALHRAMNKNMFKQNWSERQICERPSFSPQHKIRRKGNKWNECISIIIGQMHVWLFSCPLYIYVYIYILVFFSTVQQLS